MSKLKSWLANANGWKRLWFVTSVLALLYAVVIAPFQLTSDSRMSEFKYKWAVERELKRSECIQYATKPFSELQEPAYIDADGAKGCYHIYNYRRFHDQVTVPFTQKVLEENFSAQRWETLFGISAVSGFVALIAAGLVYFMGWVFSWVLGGFRKSK